MREDGFIPDLSLLRARGPAQRAWHERAAAVAADRFGGEVFLRGVVEASNFCRENCAYCGMRRDNRALDRHRARLDELAELLVHHRPPGLTDLNIQTGEDPVAVRELVLPLLRILARETPLGLSVCLGTLTPALYAELRAAGAGLYIMKFELADANAYRGLQAPGTLDERLAHIRLLAASGWRVSSGFIAGLPGQAEADALAGVRLAASLPLAGCSVSPFIPGEATPLADEPAAGLDLTLNCMAALRLQRPGWIIPAVSALNLTDETDGYRRGLRTGANLVTMNLTPTALRDDYLLYRRDRFIMNAERIHAAVEAEGLRIAARGLLRDLETPAGVNGHAASGHFAATSVAAAGAA